MGTITTVMWISIGACVVLGVPFILIWWRDMDKWADDEHKRFKTKGTDEPERIVLSSSVKPQTPPPQTTSNSTQNIP